MTRHAAPRRGFTLIEILIVIAIIAVLAGLLVVVIGKVTGTAKTAETATDIAQISNAISSYKSKMGVGYIPSCGAGGTSGGLFRLRSLYAGNEPEAIYLKSVWPQLPGCTGIKGETTGIPAALEGDLDANQTLVFFLTGGAVTNFQGFSTNRTNPFTTPTAGSTESRIGPFLTFPDKRYVANSEVPGASKAHATLLDPFGAPFAYFAFNTTVKTYKAPDPKTGAYTVDQGYAFNGTTVTPYQDATSKRYLEPNGFQIISAGENGKDDQTKAGTFGFGPGGTKWTPRSGLYAEGGAGADDIANFNGNGKLVNQN